MKAGDSKDKLFEVGDVVRLISGGPNMIVEGFVEDLSFEKDGFSKWGVTTFWAGDSGKHKITGYPQCLFRKVEA